MFKRLVRPTILTILNYKYFFEPLIFKLTTSSLLLLLLILIIQFVPTWPITPVLDGGFLQLVDFWTTVSSKIYHPSHLRWSRSATMFWIPKEISSRSALFRGLNIDCSSLKPSTAYLLTITMETIFEVAKMMGEIMTAGIGINWLDRLIKKIHEKWERKELMKQVNTLRVHVKEMEKYYN